MDCWNEACKIFCVGWSWVYPQILYEIVCTYQQLQTWWQCENLRIHVKNLTDSECGLVEIMLRSGWSCSIFINLFLFVTSPYTLIYLKESTCHKFFQDFGVLSYQCVLWLHEYGRSSCEMFFKILLFQIIPSLFLIEGSFWSWWSQLHMMHESDIKQSR